MKLSASIAALLLSVFFFSTKPLCGYDLSKDKVQYVAVTSHLDTQWLWTIRNSIDSYLPLTAFRNFYLFEKYPQYIFNFEAAYHYMLFKQYYPDHYADIKRYMEKGNWKLAGGMLVACDVNVPSPESLVRQFLYGNGFFKEEFGRKAVDVFLPDCFGFGMVLPTVGAHCGMIGFSTQKIYCPWLPQPSGAYPKPFDIGLWEGVDGSSLIAAVNPGAYTDPWTIYPEQIDTLGRTTGIYASYDYMGVGDIGGGCCCGQRGDCSEKDVISLFERIARNDQEEIKVVLAPSDQIFKDIIAAGLRDKLVRYRGEFLAREHGTGTYTSRAQMKLKNRQNELLGFSSEMASVLAGQLAGKPYPAQRIKDSWIKFLWHQFHDDLPGTSIPVVYQRYSLPDEDVAIEQFTAIRQEGLHALAAKMDTRSAGTALMVFNPLSVQRQEPVLAQVEFQDGQTPEFVRVYGPDGKEVLSQVLERNGKQLSITFMASTPACGAAVYDVRAADAPCGLPSALKASQNGLANANLEVKLDGNGDIASIRDLRTGRETLSGPMQLELLPDSPNDYPQWEIRYEDIMAQPRTVAGPAKVTVVEQGPLRATLRVERKSGGSVFVQDIHLTAAGRRVDVENRIDWQERKTLLKAGFPLKAANSKAVYDLGLGTIERGDNSANLYEAPAQQWAEITDISGGFGAAVLNDCKYGWDKPSGDKLRLTLIHTPETRPELQGGDIGDETLDMGMNRVTYSVYPHGGDWRKAGVVWEAACLNQPLTAVQIGSHAGALGKSVGFLRISDPTVALMALKQAESGDRLVLRVRELNGAAARRVSCAFPGSRIKQASELNGIEEQTGLANSKGGELSFEIGPYQVKTFSVALENAR